MVRHHEAKEAVLRALRDQRAVPVADIAAEVDAHPAVIGRCCSGLQRGGYIQQTASGVYTLTSTGEARLADLLSD